MHRDIAPSNMLLSQSLQQLKIADFDLCKHFDMKPLAMGVAHGKHATLEVLKSDDRSLQMRLDYPYSCDVYSWALYCYYALTGTESRKPLTDKLSTVMQQRIVPNINRAPSPLSSTQP